MPNLVSPGVQVTVTNEAYGSNPGPGTVPLIVLATHQNKIAPGSTSDIAPGTLKSNSDSLYLITSQRELLATFGTPSFYNIQGTPQHGHELNEYGLLAAYSYLGIANRAYVIRADINLGELSPTVTAPRGPAAPGTFWFDVGNTQYGLFQSDGGPVAGLAWKNKNVEVIDRVDESEMIAVGSTSVADPASSALVPVAGGHLVINGKSITLTGGLSLNGVVDAINAAKTGSYELTDYTASSLRIAERSYLVIRNTAGQDIKINNTSDASILAALGFALTVTNTPTTQYQAPALSIGVDGTFGVVTLSNDNKMFQKLTPQTLLGVSDVNSSSFWFVVGSQLWKAASPTVVRGSTQPAATTSGDQFKIRTTVNGVADEVLVTLSAINPGENAAEKAANDIRNAIQVKVGLTPSSPLRYVWAAPDPAYPAKASGAPLYIANSAGEDIEIINNPNNTNVGNPVVSLGIATMKGNKLFYASHTRVPSGSVSGDVWIKTSEPNKGVKYVLKFWNASSGVWMTVPLSFFGKTSTQTADQVATIAFGSALAKGSLFVEYNAVGTASDPVASQVIKRFDGTTWAVLDYQASIQAPTSAPVENALWYNTDYQVDVMVAEDGFWQAYRSGTRANVNANGVIIQASPPLVQENGGPLVSDDLWLNTGDLENYPALYRWNSSALTWDSIDKTDQTTPFGIVFADARATNNGHVDGLTAQSVMMVSDHVDPDAPDPRNYPNGMILFNTRYSTYNVKQWKPNYFASIVGTVQADPDGTGPLTSYQYKVGDKYFTADTITAVNQGRWVTISGNRVDGSPYMGRKAQRALIVRAMAASIASNQDIRSEDIYFNLVSAPGYVELLDELITLNVDNKEVAFIVSDTPARLQPTGTEISKWASNKNNAASNSEEGLTSSYQYAGLYYPWGLTTNLDGFEVMVPPSHIALRTLAYNDQVAYPWLAPAGYTRGLVSNAASVGYLTSENEYRPVRLNNGQRDVLYTNKINPIASIPNRGLVVYGQKTLDPLDASALSRVNVARLINYLRYQFDILAKPLLFEPNDHETRERAAVMFNRFLGDLIGLRALYDFAVICNDANNTPDRIDLNQLWIDVAIKPTRAIEFILIPVRVLATGADMPKG